MRRLIAAALIFASTHAHAETIGGDRIVIIDGDTVALPCDPARGIYPGCAEKIRLKGIDAPESYHPRCKAERAPALAAKARLAALLRGQPVTITRTGRDRYGRTLGHLTASGTEVESILLAEGLALPYAPGRAAWSDRCRHWCPGIARCEE